MELADAGPVRTSPNKLLAGSRAVGFVLDFVWRTKRMDEAAHGPRALHAGALGAHDAGRAREIPCRDEGTLRAHGIPGDRSEVLKFGTLAVIAAEDLGSGEKSPQPRCRESYFTTCRLFVTEKIPGTPLARKPATFLSASLSTTPSKVT